MQAVYDLLRQSFAYMEGRIDPPSSLTRMSFDDLCRKAQNETLVIAMEGEELAGCLFCYPRADWLYVGKMAVQSSRRGQGIARKLIEVAFDLAEEQRLHGLELETRVELTENHRAFENLGFIEISRSAHEGYDQPTSICMRAMI